jgi:predicted small secreted protein
LILRAFATVETIASSETGKTMPKSAFAVVCLAALVLSGCGNTAYGLKRDGQDASHAMDNATHRVLSAGAKK